MPSVGFAIPVLPGRTDLGRRALGACWRGERRAAYEDARRRAGITKEAVWIQTTPTGDLAVVYLEADDLDAAFVVIGAADVAALDDLRNQIRAVHGFSLTDGVPAPELVLDYDSGM